LKAFIQVLPSGAKVANLRVNCSSFAITDTEKTRTRQIIAKVQGPPLNMLIILLRSLLLIAEVWRKKGARIPAEQREGNVGSKATYEGLFVSWDIISKLFDPIVSKNLSDTNLYRALTRKTHPHHKSA
jgi:hypothetical protein